MPAAHSVARVSAAHPGSTHPAEATRTPGAACGLTRATGWRDAGGAHRSPGKRSAPGVYVSQPRDAKPRVRLAALPGLLDGAMPAAHTVARVSAAHPGSTHLTDATRNPGRG